jgi:hypothetical protein|eukprot:7323036-Prymnesium_polylepis.1
MHPAPFTFGMGSSLILSQSPHPVPAVTFKHSASPNASTYPLEHRRGLQALHTECLLARLGREVRDAHRRIANAEQPRKQGAQRSIGFAITRWRVQICSERRHGRKLFDALYLTGMDGLE